MPDEGMNVPFMQRKLAGVPMWLIILGGAALVAYLYFSHKASAGAQAQGIKTTGGGGTSSTGRTVVYPGAVKINVSAKRGSNGEDDDDQPKPPHHGKHKGQSGDIDLQEISIDQARELRKDVSSHNPRVWYGLPGGEKLQVSPGMSYEKAQREGTGHLYTTQFNYDKYLKGKKG